jgi:hypothetical protein
MENKKGIRRRRLMVETERILIVRGHQREVNGWCDQCGSEVKLLTPEVAAALTGLSRRAVYRLIETAEVHFSESPDALVSICLESLTKVKPFRTAHHFQSE